MAAISIMKAAEPRDRYVPEKLRLVARTLTLRDAATASFHIRLTDRA